MRHHRIIVATLILLGLQDRAFSLVSPPTTQVCVQLHDGVMVCHAVGSGGSAVSVHDADSQPSSASSATTVTYGSYQSIDSDGAPGGGACLSTTYYPLGPAPVLDPRQAFISPEPDRINYGYPPCPAQPAAPGEPE